jgi:hypothetical protein
MAPSVAEPSTEEPIAQRYAKKLPPAAIARLQRAQVDLSGGYPWISEDPPKYVDEVLKIRSHEKLASMPLS